MTDEEKDLAARLSGLTPASRLWDVSGVRKAIRHNFDAITKARKKGVAWQQIAEAMAADGVKASDGTIPTAHEIRVLFHAERYARGGKRERRRKGETPAVTPPAAPPSPTASPVSVQEEDPAAALESTFRPLRKAAAPSGSAPSSPVQPAPQMNADDTIARLMSKRSSDRPAMPPIPKPQRDED